MLKQVVHAPLIMFLMIFISNAQEPLEMLDEDKPYLLNYKDLEDSFGRVVLTNDNVVLQRLVVPAGRWEGQHSHPGNQLYVHIYGGYWSGKMAGEIVYSHELSPDGEGGWMDHIPYEDGHDSGNTGDTDIDLIYVSLKKEGHYGAGIETKPQEFSDFSMDVVFENDRLIAQRGEIAPGQWTGAHNRPGNQLYILVKGGTLTEQQAGKQISSTALEDGAPKWLEAGDGYEFGNIGENTIDMVLITIK